MRCWLWVILVMSFWWQTVKGRPYVCWVTCATTDLRNEETCRFIMHKLWRGGPEKCLVDPAPCSHQYYQYHQYSNIIEPNQGLSVPAVTGSAFLSPLGPQVHLSGLKGEVAAQKISSMAETLLQHWLKDLCLKEQTVLTALLGIWTQLRLISCATRGTAACMQLFRAKGPRSAGANLWLIQCLSRESPWIIHWSVQAGQDFFFFNGWFWTP